MVTAPRSDEETEAYARLLEMAGSRTKPIPADLLVRHLMSVTEGADWRVRSDAMAALLRRVKSASADGLVDDAGGGYLGLRQTRRKGRRNGARPYSTLFTSVDPPGGSCDCPDFLKSSLGLCKHLIATLAFVHEKPGRLSRALAEQRARCVPASRLFWSPVRPLSGPGDWMAQVRLVTTRAPSWAAHLLESFTRETSEGWAPSEDILEDRAARRQLAQDVSVAVESRSYRKSDPDPDPALVALLAAELRADAGVPGLLDTGCRSLKLPLYGYQQEAVERFAERGRLLLADDMGLGKTAQAAAIAHALYDRGAVKRGLVIVPASLKGQWAREWERFTDAPLFVVDGPPEARRALYERSGAGFLVLNYELVIRDLDDLLELDPELVILDEAQRIKNWTTKTARAVKRFDPPYRLVLTGTPMQNRLEELASIMEWVDERALEPRWRLVPLHTEDAGDGGRGLAAARNLDTLRTRLAGSMLRRRRSEVLEQLPERTDTIVPIEMTAAQQEEHDALEFPIRRLLAISRRRPLSHDEFLRLMCLLNTQRMISNALGQVEFEDVWPAVEGRRPTRALLDSVGSPKLLELRELVQNVVVEQKRKVVIFSEWRRMLRLAGWAVSDILSAEGLRAVFFTGAESRKQRDRAVVELSDDPSTRVLFLSDAGGVGLNLQRAASCCVNLELPWNPAVLEQRIGRIHRLGQSTPVDVFNLVTTTGIEERIERIVRGKKALFDAVFDGDSQEVRFDEHHSFLDRLEREYVPPISEEDVTEEEEDEAAVARLVDPGDDRAPAVESRGGDRSEGEGRRAVDGIPTSAASVVSPLFDRVRIERTAEGGMRLEAPPEAAKELAALFEGVARLFGSGA